MLNNVWLPCTDRSERELLTQGRPLFLGIDGEVAANYREQEWGTESFEILLSSVEHRLWFLVRLATRWDLYPRLT
ncbi:hypothetical protein D3D01_17950 [Haloarcula sp. Atlit-7R]|nr:hypothetical protein DVK01_11895 [Haloarcula sp. Atlit-120R]RLM89986.1 hypothetical protein D3D01_17950 [Haloarcula sp. Atlit-7R]